MSLLIVEGPDAAGKTTLIDCIEAQLKGHIQVYHHGAYLKESNIAHYYLQSICSALRRDSELVVMDRSWIAEPIYGEVMRNGNNRINKDERYMLEVAARLAGAKIVLCLPPFSVCEQKWSERLDREYPQKSEQLKGIYNGYQNEFQHWGNGLMHAMPWVHFDYTQTNNFKFAKALLTGIQK